MIVPLTVVSDRCKLGKDKEQCIYLFKDPEKPNFRCLKVTPLAKSVHQLHCNIKKTDTTPSGNNCTGYQEIDYGAFYEGGD